MTLGLLEKFTNYSIYVLAMTKAGEGPKSTEVFCKTLDDGESNDKYSYIQIKRVIYLSAI